MRIQCKMTPERKTEVWSMFRDGLRDYEAEAFRNCFLRYLFVIETWGEKGIRTCWCQNCHQHFDVFKSEDKAFFRHHHGDLCECPQCGADVELQFISRAGKGGKLYQSEPAVFVRAAKDGGVLIEGGIGFMNYYFGGDYPEVGDLEPDIHWIAKSRYYLSRTERMEWYRGLNYFFDRCFGPQNWVERKNITEPMHANPLFGYGKEHFLFGLDELQQTDLKYSMLYEFFSEYFGENLDMTDYWEEMPQKTAQVVTYLATYSKYPQVEMAVKLDMMPAVYELMSGNTNRDVLNWSAKTPWAFTRMTKPEYKIFSKTPSLDLLRTWKKLKEEGRDISLKSMTEIYAELDNYAAGKLLTCADSARCTVTKALHYISRHGILKKKALELWADYLSMAEKLHYDMDSEEIRMPKKLQEKHDEAVELLKTEEEKIAERKYKTIYQKLKKKYEFEYDGLEIIVPKNAAEIIAEGQVLQHCVKGYAARHMKGETVILFLRRSRRPERSYITIEMDGVRIRQTHGYQNERKGQSAPREKHSEFFKTWLDWLSHGSRRDKTGNPIMNEKEKTA